MPFSSQPRKKGTLKPQGEHPSSCGCSEHKKVVDIPTDKKKIANILDKISDKMTKEKKAAEKAAFVISGWINGKKR